MIETIIIFSNHHIQCLYKYDHQWTVELASIWLFEKPNGSIFESVQSRNKTELERIFPSSTLCRGSNKSRITNECLIHIWQIIKLLMNCQMAPEISYAKILVITHHFNIVRSSVDFRLMFIFLYLYPFIVPSYFCLVNS